MNKIEFSKEAVINYRKYSKELRNFLKNGEIYNPINLNVPNYMNHALDYGEIVCKLLEKEMDRGIE